MNILPRRRGPSNFIIESIAHHAKAISDRFHYLGVDLTNRPFVDQGDIDEILKQIATARARFDCIEAELTAPTSRARETKPSRGVPVPGGIVDWGDTAPTGTPSP